MELTQENLNTLISQTLVTIGIDKISEIVIVNDFNDMFKTALGDYANIITLDNLSSDKAGRVCFSFTDNESELKDKCDYCCLIQTKEKVGILNDSLKVNEFTLYYNVINTKESNKLRVITTFSGIGTQEMALRDAGIDYELVGFCEIDKYAIQSYKAIHGDLKNYGDITQVEKLDECDFLTYSFPCTDLSGAGLQKGFYNEDGTLTRSGLLLHVGRLLDVYKEENKLPKYLMMENVKALTQKKFMPDFQRWLDYLDNLGYNNYWKVLNAKDYGVPQNRERVFVISIRKDIDDKSYVFPDKIPLTIKLKDVLEPNVEDKFYIDDKHLKNLDLSKYMKKENELNIIGRTTYGGERSGIYDVNGIAPANTATMHKQPTQIIVEDNIDNPNLEMIGGIGEKNFGKKYIQGNRVYDSNKIAACLTAQPVGSMGGQTSLYLVEDNPNLNNDVNRIGGILDKDGKQHQIGSVYDYDGVSPTLDTMQGGNRQPLIIDDFYPNRETRVYSDYSPSLRSERNGLKVVDDNQPLLIGGTQKHQAIKTDSISTCLTAATGTGGGYVPMITEEVKVKQIGNIVTTGNWDNNQRGRIYDIEGLSPTLNTMQGGGLEPKILVNTDCICCAERGRETDDSNGKPYEQKLEVNMQGTISTLTSVQKDNLILEVNKQQSIITDVAPAQTTICGTTTSSSTVMIKYDNLRIRKLTPLECWRLMGCRDEDFYKAKNSGVSNSQLYKQAGNAIVVDVMKYMFQNLFKQK